MASEYDKKAGIVGRLWNKVARSGNNFKSGYIEIGGEKVDLVIFHNRKREGEAGANDADYVIKISEPMQQRQERRTEEIAAEAFDDVAGGEDLPF